MSERHAYGTSCGCVSRRIFVLVSCLVLAVLCYLQLGRWFLELHLLSPATEDANQRLHCTGTECLEVWSCYGMRETTYHLREPFVTAVGAVTLPLGVYGALQGSQWHLQAATLYLILGARCFQLDNGPHRWLTLCTSRRVAPTRSTWWTRSSWRQRGLSTRLSRRSCL
ncbi:unnamed protein product [Prorocentrum cordatum]|uniref:Mannosyltransferase n=1 Tax=Prorocentrum cordatum TaxID=2364126 RepID=A0ABN9RIZ9_9DINO|nr:unnamed protein product [Polarella glacialis]